jgi:hypothetical protein
LFATVLKTADKDSYIKYKISIPVERIDLIEVKKMNVFLTVIGIVVVAFVVLFVAAASGGPIGP